MKEISILFSDDHLAVAVKPAGILSQGGEGGGEHMISLLKAQLGGEIFPIHRLDRETAGVMVFARKASAAAALSKALREKRFRKEYLAILTAKPKEEGDLEDLLFYDRRKNKVFPVKRERKGVKKARLSYKLEAEADGLYLVRVFPETGRTHQIRVQFASRRLPLYGDRKYGGKGEQLGLFCHTLIFPHPASGDFVSFSAEPVKESPWSLFSSL